MALENKKGRPAHNRTAIIEELKCRYPNGPEFTSADDLFAANPDLLPKLKTLKNTAKESFGMSLGQYLKSIGLIGRVASIRTRSEDEEMRQLSCNSEDIGVVEANECLASGDDNPCSKDTKNLDEILEIEKIEKMYQLIKTSFYETLVYDLTSRVERHLSNPDHIVEVWFRGFKFQIERAKEILKEFSFFSSRLKFSCDQTDNQDIYELKIKESMDLYFAMKEVLQQIPELKMYALIWADFYLPMYCWSDVGYGYITSFGYESDNYKKSPMPNFLNKFDYVIKKDNVYYAVRKKESGNES